MRTETYHVTVKNGVIVKANEILWIDGKMAYSRPIESKEYLLITLDTLASKPIAIKE